MRKYQTKFDNCQNLPLAAEIYTDIFRLCLRLKTESTMQQPSSCDTFIALPPVTVRGSVIFGKNSDRAPSEVQEVIYCKSEQHTAGSSLKCTYIEIPQIACTYDVILSKPAWMWGAEMGANSKGVVIGNEAVWTKEMGEGDKEEKLLGMDLVRLGLERGSSAKEALEVMTNLLKEFGQGGRCFEDPSKANMVYQNSFIIADGTEAWVLETAGKHWAAEWITDGVRNISNKLSIGTKIDLSSDGLADHAKSQGWWNPDDGEFNFAEAYSAPPGATDLDPSEDPSRRYECGRAMMEKLSASNDFGVTSMFKVLRDEDGGICRTGKSGSVTTASQVSVLVASGNEAPSCHWFTATPNPARSVFKPFFFCPEVDMGVLTASPTFGEDDPVKVQPRFQSTVDRAHPLYASHAEQKPLPGDEFNPKLLDTIRELEVQCINDVEEFMTNYQPSQLKELQDLFKDVVDVEMKFYRAIGGGWAA